MEPLREPEEAGGDAPFDVSGPLPTGTTVLEASAGTGKTYTIAALAARYVAEGVAELPQLMLVTFSRAATQELRERVRERLVTAERGLVDPVRARAAADDTLLQLLADAPDDEVAARRDRLTRALAGFDAATIATTHGFCQQMLAGLGMAGDLDPDATFVEDVDDLVTEVVGDLYLRKFAADPDPPRIDHATALRVARAAVSDAQATLVPSHADAGTVAQLRYGMATTARDEVAVRKRLRRVLDYDDLLSRLDDALQDPVRGAAAAERVRSRYRVVLVDEFQDTDPLQWRILRTAFHGATTLVLIGDPKQAIYAFRGADLVTYLQATEAATTRRTLARNWRSDAPLLIALGAVFRGAALGDRRIPVRAVHAHHDVRRLHGAGPPLRLRVLGRALVDAPERARITVKEARPIVAEDVARDVVSLLEGPARLALDHQARPLSPSDVAVLVRTNDQAAMVRDALHSAGVPAVLTGGRSVFLAPAAREWLTLLRALEQPHRAGLARAAALTSFVGWSPQRLAADDSAGTDELGRLLRGWRDVLADRGVAALQEVMTSATGLVERLLADVDGERQLTDIRHIGQSLHAAAVSGRLGQAAVVAWLQRRISEAAADTADERTRRLESDADAAQVVTVHGSKGLQFPVVYVPFGWDRHVGDSPDPLRLHDPGGVRLLDVGGKEGPGYEDRRLEHVSEELGEDLRLLYVGMTRARCQVVAWWAPATTSEHAPLTRLLFGDVARGEQPPARVSLPRDAAVRERLEALAAESGGTLAVEQVGEDRPARWHPRPAEPTGLAAASFDRRLDASWRRTSYTGLTRAVHEGHTTPVGVASEPEVEERQDEPELMAPPEAPGDLLDEALRSVPSPMAELPSGAAFGTLVHGVLETVDTRAADLAAELRLRCRDAVGARLGTTVEPEALAAALLPVLVTPLGPLTATAPRSAGVTLADVTPADRLAELDFELPLAGGDSPRTDDATLAEVADSLRRHLPTTDPLASYADALDVPLLRGQRLRGYLTGSIDAVLRLRGAGGEPRYVVVDYKTNWLGGFGPAGADPLTAWDYRPAALAQEMIRAHYPLQALLYAVALHRFLRWRQPSYDPGRHLGGVLYLFVRGMCGPETPVVDGVPCGVFSWQPPVALVEAVSELLDA
ncbi:MAG TPA: UvrD-helicase domain-containing protein [Jiangellales bacterium]|nr:UvrD-helicase domain-containing protein [Jiangellales bacterium]